MPEKRKNVKPKERAAASGEDRIGALPGALLMHALSLLPADEAVRTCALARGWRDLWRYTPSLRIIHAERSRFRRAEHFTKFVNHLICLRDSSPLVKCEISLSRSDIDEPYPYVNMWIQYALTCQVRVLQVIGNYYVNQRLLLNVPLWISRHLMTLHLGSADLECSLGFSSCPVLRGSKNL